jgi:hypothetical protein
LLLLLHWAKEFLFSFKNNARASPQPTDKGGSGVGSSGSHNRRGSANDFTPPAPIPVILFSCEAGLLLILLLLLLLLLLLWLVRNEGGSD